MSRDTNDPTQLTAAEQTIRLAALAVRAAGTHPLLTEATGLLQRAQNKVADFVALTDTPTATTPVQ